MMNWSIDAFDMLVEDVSDHSRLEKANIGTNCTKISSFSNSTSIKLAFWNLFKSDILVNISFISCNKKERRNINYFSLSASSMLHSNRNIHQNIWKNLMPSVFAALLLSKLLMAKRHYRNYNRIIFDRNSKWLCRLHMYFYHSI